MTGKKYETLEHTADIMIKAYGDSIEECFANAAYGLFDQLADLKDVRPSKDYRIEIEGKEPEQLLVDFLSELLYLFDTELILLSEFDIKYDGEMLVANAKGEPIDKKRHRMKQAIKAVSYHAIEVAPKKGYVQVLFDA
ncbi:MAG: archease [Thermoplasmata archaeon]|nr:archease [Thermoplasmata archaeon]